jgi:3-isopropylmalate/(R)-2-methylmalate dehydratase small subunit
VTVDLGQQTIVCGDLHFHFTIDPAWRIRLLNGWDDIDLTESFRSEINAFKAANLKQRPWTVPRKRREYALAHAKSSSYFSR